MRCAFFLPVLAACAADTSLSPDVVTSAQDQLLVVQSAPPLSVARGATGDRNLMTAVVENLMPRNFAWVMVSVDDSHAEAVRTTGLSFDVATDSGITFSQVWLDACNPAIGDFEPCYQFERYEAGEPGFTGTMSLSISDGEVHGAYDVTWEGTSNRYGQPAYFKHGSSGGFAGSYLPID